MPKLAYTEKKFRASSMELIDNANTIIERYQARNLMLTIRQLFYQFVSRNLFANTERNYQRLISVISDARLAGLVDWSAIEDRGRRLRRLPNWSSPQELIRQDARYYWRRDLWEKQDYFVEIWVEKEALAGVFEDVCNENDVGLFACKGYVSQTSLWEAAQRLGQVYQPVVLHLGDHDPSGIDMTRDIRDRFSTFGVDVEVVRVALNMDQIEQYNPPPNPARVTDSRYDTYRQEYGDESWELDALDPEVLVDLAQQHIDRYKDEELFEEAKERQERERKDLTIVAMYWDKAVKAARGGVVDKKKK